MNTAGMQGVRRARRVRTTIADEAAARPADLVKRDFTAAERAVGGRLHLRSDPRRVCLHASLDPARHIAHLGASELIEVDTATNHVVRVVDHLDGVHGLLVVPALHRVFASATDANQVVTLDEDTGAVLGRAPTGDFPDGLAYQPGPARIWVTNETGGNETVLDTATGKIVATVDVGGEAGNVAYDPGTRTSPAQVLVDVQAHNEVALIDPSTFMLTRRIPVPGCDHPHGLALDTAHRLGFIACDGIATVLTIDLDTHTVGSPQPVGDNPDVVALDRSIGWLYVAGEGGEVSVLAERGRALSAATTSPTEPTSSPSTLSPTAATFPFPAARAADRNC